jgi:hypothetical protein
VLSYPPTLISGPSSPPRGARTVGDPLPPRLAAPSRKAAESASREPSGRGEGASGGKRRRIRGIATTGSTLAHQKSGSKASLSAAVSPLGQLRAPALERIHALLMDELRGLCHHDELATVQADHRQLILAAPEIDELVGVDFDRAYHLDRVGGPDDGIYRFAALMLALCVFTKPSAMRSRRGSAWASASISPGKFRK